MISQALLDSFKKSFILTVEDAWGGMRREAVSQAWLPSDQGALISQLAQARAHWRERGPELLRAQGKLDQAQQLESYFAEEPLPDIPWPLSRARWGGVGIQGAGGSVAETERGLGLMALGRCGFEVRAQEREPGRPVGREGRSPIAISERGLVVAVRCLKPQGSEPEPYLLALCAALGQERSALVEMEDFAKDPTSFVSNNADAWRERAMVRDEQLRLEKSMGQAPRRIPKTL